MSSTTTTTGCAPPVGAEIRARARRAGPGLGRYRPVRCGSRRAPAAGLARAGQIPAARTQQLVEVGRRERLRNFPERLDDRAERQPLAAEGDTTALQHARAQVAAACRDLADEPRLAHAGFTRDEEERRVSLSDNDEGRGKPVEFATSADEDRARDPTRHRRELCAVETRGRDSRSRRTRNESPISPGWMCPVRLSPSVRSDDAGFWGRATRGVSQWSSLSRSGSRGAALQGRQHLSWVEHWPHWPSHSSVRRRGRTVILTPQLVALRRA